MIVLLDTATPVCRLRLVDADNHINSEWQADRTLAKGLLGYLQSQLAQHQKSLSDITGIGVFQGPGSFTGLRIGMAVLNTLADSERIPIVGVRGDDWQKIALDRLRAGENDQVVLPFYGSEAHITTPRK